MALIIKDRIQETWTGTGTGNVALGGAPLGYNTFSSVMTAPSDTTYYALVNPNAATTEWEVGIGTYSGANTLTRSTVLANSLGTTALISFTAGTKYVFIDAPAAKLVLTDASGVIASPSISSPTFSGTIAGTPAVDSASSLSNQIFTLNFGQTSYEYVLTATNATGTGSVATLSFATLNAPNAIPVGSTILVSGVTTTGGTGTVATTAASGTGTTATISFAAQAVAPPVGSVVTIAGVTPTGYNGTYTVTASSTTSVSYANTTTGVQTVAGTVLFTYNGLFTVSASSATTVSFVSPAFATFSAVGTIQAGKLIPVTGESFTVSLASAALWNACTIPTGELYGASQPIVQAGNAGNALVSTITSSTGTGAAATLTFAVLAEPPRVGSTITVAGNGAYDGSFTVTASTPTTVTYASSATGLVTGGTITFETVNTLTDEFEMDAFSVAISKGTSPTLNVSVNAANPIVGPRQIAVQLF